MRKMIKIRRDESGMGVVEFGLIAPVFVTFVIAISQFGILYFAQSGLKSAVAEGARYASIYPRPTNAEILTKITGTRFGMKAEKITAPTVNDCVEDGRKCVDIQMSYEVPLNFVFFSWDKQVLTERRRVFLAEMPTSGNPGTGGSGGSGGGNGGGGGKDKGDDGEDPAEPGDGDCKGSKCEPEPEPDPEPDPDQPSDPDPTTDPTDDPKNNPKGDEPKGSDPKGDDPKGSDPKGDDPKGSDPKGDDPKGSDPKGDDTTPSCKKNC